MILYKFLLSLPITTVLQTFLLSVSHFIGIKLSNRLFAFTEKLLGCTEKGIFLNQQYNKSSWLSGFTYSIHWFSMKHNTSLNLYSLKSLHIKYLKSKQKTLNRSQIALGESNYCLKLVSLSILQISTLQKNSVCLSKKII